MAKRVMKKNSTLEKFAQVQASALTDTNKDR